MSTILTTRGGDGLKVYRFDQMSGLTEVATDASSCIRAVAHSDDGSKFAYCNGKSVVVRDSSKKKVIFELDKPKTSRLMFSPSGKVLATWEPYAVTQDQPNGVDNLCLFDANTGVLLKSFVQKKSDNWCPQWTADDFLCAKNVNSEVHFYKENDFSGHLHSKLVIKDLNKFALTKTTGTYHVAVYVPGQKSQPSYVRFFRYPGIGNPSDALANKSFYKADQADLIWNPRGTALLILTSVEVSTESYYGEQALHFMSAQRPGETAVVPMPKKGPIYHVEWRPFLAAGTAADVFVVTHGLMPAQVTVFNMNCEVIFDFGTGPRNVTHFNPQGNILCLAGFGNLKGDIEMWDFERKLKIVAISAADTTQFAWAPDGEHFVAATTAPRLRVNNGFRIWHYTGRLVVSHESVLPEGKTTGTPELFEVQWRPVSAPPPPPKIALATSHVQQVTGGVQSSPTVAGVGGSPGAQAAAVKVGRYVPPALRNRPDGGAPGNRIMVEDYLPPSNQRDQQGQDNSSKQAQKSKRHRDNKKVKGLQVENEDGCHGGITETPSMRTGQLEFVSTGDVEKDKKIRNLVKKLQQIDKLKEQKIEGKQLELNQLDKIKTEAALRDELKKLQL